MPLHGATADEKSNDSPLGRGTGRQALGWVVDRERTPSALRAIPEAVKN